MDEDNDTLKLSDFEMIIANNMLYYAVCELQLLSSLPGLSNDLQIDRVLCTGASSSHNHKENEVEKTRFCLEDTLTNVCNELLKSNTWCILENTLINLRNENKDHSRLFKDNVKKSQEKLSKLKFISVTVEKDLKEKMKQTDIDVSSLKDDIQDANFQQSVEIKYIDKWERSRVDQSIMLAEMEERRLKYQLESVLYQTDTEERIHNDVATYLEDITNKLENDIQSWKEKYKEISSVYDKELSIIRERRNKQLEHLKALTDKYYEHGQKIKEYLEEKREREDQEELQQHLNKMATKLQAWWRGVMVRRHLGPYKKKGKAKDKPKFKGKGNKLDAGFIEKPTEKQGKKGK